MFYLCVFIIDVFALHDLLHVLYVCVDVFLDLYLYVSHLCLLCCVIVGALLLLVYV